MEIPHQIRFGEQNEVVEGIVGEPLGEEHAGVIDDAIDRPEPVDRRRGDLRSRDTAFRSTVKSVSENALPPSYCDLVSRADVPTGRAASSRANPG
jgi:hypothetical protein